MATDSYSSTWVSHSSIGDYLKCRKLYYLKQVYKDPISNHKIALINPYLTLGLTVHETLESLSELGVDIRFKDSLTKKFENIWTNYSGELGGFKNKDEENQFKERGLMMIKRVVDNPGPLLNKALRLKDKDPNFTLPRFKLSVEDNIMLSGKIDWLEYVEKDDSVRIIDFKTSLKEEESGSLQLPIYCLLVKNCQNREVSGISYWYLEKENKPTSLDLPDLVEAKSEILSIALQIKEVRAKGIYKCLKGGCFACTPMERIVKGEGKLVSHNSYQDIYIIKN